VSGKKSVAVLGPLERFERPKVIIRQSAPELVAVIDEANFVCSHSYFVISARTNSRYDIYYLGGILSSHVLSEYAVKNDVIKIAEGKQPQVRKAGLDSLPIPTPTNQTLVRAVSEMVKAIIASGNDRERSERFRQLEELVVKCYNEHSIG